MCFTKKDIKNCLSKVTESGVNRAKKNWKTSNSFPGNEITLIANDEDITEEKYQLKNLTITTQILLNDHVGSDL